MTSIARRPRPLVALALAASAVAATAGCSVTNAQSTSMYYVAGDGAEARLSSTVTVSGVMFLAEDADSPGTLIARVVNSGTDTATVQFQGQDVNLSVDVDPGRTVAVGPDGDEELLLDRMGYVPGSQVPMLVGLPDGSGQDELRVPVLDGGLAEYADLVPTADAAG